jgi:predicted TIM-barrel fold metal-dependent hydrolase
MSQTASREYGPCLIDIQTHYAPPAAAGILRSYGERTGLIVAGLAPALSGSSPIFGSEERLREMDAAGIDVSVLSFAPIGAIDDPAVRIDLCRAANDGLLEMCAAHPGRFVAAAMLPLPDADAAFAELARIGNDDRIRAVQIVAQTALYRLDELGLDDLFRAVADSRLPLIVHPSAGIADLAAEFDAYGLSSGMHAMVSNALLAARMIQSGMLDRIPGLDLIVTHLGGILPFLADRLDSRNTGPSAFPPSHYLRSRLWFDACGYPAGPALRCALETVGTARMMIGSDWPSRPIGAALQAVRDLRLGEEATRAILGGNAARWFDPARPRGTAPAQ